MAMITKWYTFEAAHQLPGHKGKCAREHGHTYQLGVVLYGPIKNAAVDKTFVQTITVANPPGNVGGVESVRSYLTVPDPQSDDGFVMDYGDISDIIKPLVAKYADHQNLNKTLTTIPRTTAELIACWFFGAILRVADGKIISRQMVQSFSKGKQVPMLHTVIIRETATSEAEVTMDDYNNVFFGGRRPGTEASID